MWKKVADVRWSGDSCVAGGFGSVYSDRKAPDQTDSVDLRNMHMPASEVENLRRSFDVQTDPVFDVEFDGFMLP